MKPSFFKCECGHGGLHISYDHTFGLELANLSRDPFMRSWGHRLQSAWAALCGRPYTDMIILNKAQTVDLVDYITAAVAESSDERYAERLEYIERQLFASGHCETSVDGILKWANSSDCSGRAHARLKESL